MNNSTDNAAGRFRTIATVLVLLARETEDGTVWKFWEFYVTIDCYCTLPSL